MKLKSTGKKNDVFFSSSETLFLVQSKWYFGWNKVLDFEFLVLTQCSVSLERECENGSDESQSQVGTRHRKNHLKRN